MTSSSIQPFLKPLMAIAVTQRGIKDACKKATNEQLSPSNPYLPPNDTNRSRSRKRYPGFPSVLILCLAALSGAVGAKGMRDAYLYKFYPDADSWILSWGPVACVAVSLPLIMLIAVVAIAFRPQFSLRTWAGIVAACLIPVASLVAIFV